MTLITANGLTLDYQTRGSGPAILLIMGLGGQQVAWPDDFVNDLVSAGFQVVWFDNRDIGLSSKIDIPPPSLRQQLFGAVRNRSGSAPYLLSDMAKDCVGLLDGLGIDAAHLVGVSMGGMIAQTLAIEHPTRVMSLTSVMSNTGNKRQGGINLRIVSKLRKLMDPTPANAIETQVAMFRLIGGPLVDDDEVRLIATRSLERNFDRDGVSRQMAAIAASPNRTAGLRTVTAPTLVVHGMVDPLVGFSGGVATAKAVPNARLLAFPQMGHDLPKSLRPEITASILSNISRASTSVESVAPTDR